MRVPDPNGDVPADTGVCTDEIIRSGRAVRIDLQNEVHKEIVPNWSAYPHDRRGRQNHPDPNIDRRRPPNLPVFFGRKRETIPIAYGADDYSPGDLVTWNWGRGVPPIGIVIDPK